VLGKFGGDYTPIFIVSGCAYLVALAVVHVINPRYARVTKFAILQG
jgi:ACS family hexuronate transporter-like MFS transporter